MIGTTEGIGVPLVQALIALDESARHLDQSDHAALRYIWQASVQIMHAVDLALTPPETEADCAGETDLLAYELAQCANDFFERIEQLDLAVETERRGKYE